MMHLNPGEVRFEFVIASAMFMSSLSFRISVDYGDGERGTLRAGLAWPSFLQSCSNSTLQNRGNYTLFDIIC